MLRHVDWARTRAYAIGLSGIYLNLKGRESQGTVLAQDAGSVKAALCQALTGLLDRERPGVSPFIAPSRVRRSIAAPSWKKPRTSPSISPRGTEFPGQVSMGGVAEAQFEDNVKKWSGDHIIDPDFVPGVLFMNRPFRARGAAA